MMVLAAVATLAMMAAETVSLTRIYVGAAWTGTLATSTLVIFACLLAATLLGWYAIPMATMHLLDRADRRRRPFAWRFLAQDNAIRSLTRPSTVAALRAEAARDGKITVARAGSLLRRMEAEILESFACPPAGDPASTGWRVYDAPRVSRVLAAKARLLDSSSGEVEVERVYDWIDLAVDELVNHRAVSWRRTPVDEVLLIPQSRSRARRVLGISGWQSPAALFVPCLVVPLIVAVAIAVTKEAMGIFTMSDEASSAVLTLASALVVPLAAILLDWIARRRR